MIPSPARRAASPRSSGQGAARASHGASLASFVALAVLVLGAACHPKEKPAPIASDAAAPADAAPAPDCRSDNDCVPLNCCFATSESSCIGRARAHCDAVVVQCGEATGARYDCTCAAGACAARLVAGAPDATPEPPAERPIAVGDLRAEAVIAAISKRAADVRACRTTARGAVGTVIMTWDVTPAGGVVHPAMAASSLTDPKLGACLIKKISAWRFPRAKNATRVTYPFHFSS